MLADQTVTAFKSETSIGDRVASGCLKSGVLSPLLRSLVVDELRDEIGQSCKVVEYAQDLMIFVRVRYLDSLMEITENLRLVETCFFRKLGRWPAKED